MSGCAWDSETAQWVSGLPVLLAEKLARAGLVPKLKEQEREFLGAFLESYQAKRADDVKPATLVVWRQGRSEPAGVLWCRSRVAEHYRG